MIDKEALFFFPQKFIDNLEKPDPNDTKNNIRKLREAIEEFALQFFYPDQDYLLSQLYMLTDYSADPNPSSESELYQARAVLKDHRKPDDGETHLQLEVDPSSFSLTKVQTR